MTSYANNKDALAICDNCGSRWKHYQLKFQVVAGHLTDWLHCPDCIDEDNPQLQIGKVRIDDPQAIRDPRPDTSLPVSEGLFGWGPVLGIVIFCYPAGFPPSPEPWLTTSEVLDENGYPVLDNDGLTILSDGS